MVSRHAAPNVDLYLKGTLISSLLKIAFATTGKEMGLLWEMDDLGSHDKVVRDIRGDMLSSAP